MIVQPTPENDKFRPLRRIGGILGAAGIGALLLLGAVNIAYAGKIYPGVRADGVQVGGLSAKDAEAMIRRETDRFEGEILTLEHDSRILRIPVGKLGVGHDAARSAQQAYAYGRQGSGFDRLRAQMRALLGRDTAIITTSYDDAMLASYLAPYLSDLSTPVRDASLDFDSERVRITEAETGRRVDVGRLTLLVRDRLATLRSDNIPVPVYDIEPRVPTAALKRAAGRVENALAGPLTLDLGTSEREVSVETLVSWLRVQRVDPVSRLTPRFALPPQVSVTVDEKKIEGFIKNVAASTDQDARNVELAFVDGKVTAVGPSRTGRSLDQPAAVKTLIAELSREEASDAADRRVKLAIKETQAEVREDNFESLGLKEQISQGVTYFPGSTAQRIINVRTGAARYNGLLIKPDQVFSFNQYLGDVTAEAGFVQEKVIIGNKIEKQYGGGLCQVSSTAYRAALLAGLPILERHNHSYAVSYYTAPYNAPGLDATIYAPSVDMKFKNDTGSYILIQTRLEGTSLKFDFYGTKTKTGVIRGPEFVSGSNDASKPSHTVFHRDIVDLSGKVIKSDPVHTHYKPSGEFSDKPQYN